MRVVLQRVNHAAVRIDGETVGQIQKGYLLLVGLAPEDTDEQLDWMVHKIVNLRVFEDENGKLNRALADVNGEILSISQFTLYADVKRGNRPGFSKAAKPEIAAPLYDRFNEKLRQAGVHVETGRFGADMKVELENDGPVTILYEK
ncbi:D-aminoacyl-tRNA deacylase [Limosilactobacillus mucosae]|uniref:D-aminoacyl-tRNA deacylase n=1 Tax=Limosilactobacillus mucosae TaxID=97478 RepID=UPI003EBDAA18